jgi:glycosyltransferase involved in cell wall biosynthesis
MIKDEEDEIIVSDDASMVEIIEEIKSFPEALFIFSKHNKGLAGNINKGIDACSGKFIIYCQEDFLLDLELKNLLPEYLKILKSKKIDLIRFSSYFNFNKTREFNDDIKIIPKFCWSNFFQNFYRYSDHPFIIQNNFHEKYGYYLENTSGRYGETEYAVRLSNSKVVIAITKKPMAYYIDGSQSTLINEVTPLSQGKLLSGSRLHKFMRAFRLYFECVFYNQEKRGLITYKNGRKSNI